MIHVLMKTISVGFDKYITFYSFCLAGYEFDYIFDWTILKYQQAQKNKTQPRVSVSILSTLFIVLSFLTVYYVCSDFGFRAWLVLYVSYFEVVNYLIMILT